MSHREATPIKLPAFAAAPLTEITAAHNNVAYREQRSVTAAAALWATPSKPAAPVPHAQPHSAAPAMTPGTVGRLTFIPAAAEQQPQLQPRYVFTPAKQAVALPQPQPDSGSEHYAPAAAIAAAYAQSVARRDDPVTVAQSYLMATPSQAAVALDFDHTPARVTTSAAAAAGLRVAPAALTFDDGKENALAAAEVTAVATLKAPKPKRDKTKDKAKRRRSDERAAAAAPKAAAGDEQTKAKAETKAAAKGGKGKDTAKAKTKAKAGSGKAPTSTAAIKPLYGNPKQLLALTASANAAKAAAAGAAAAPAAAGTTSMRLRVDPSAAANGANGKIPTPKALTPVNGGFADGAAFAFGSGGMSDGRRATIASLSDLNSVKSAKIAAAVPAPLMVFTPTAAASSSAALPPIASGPSSAPSAAGAGAGTGSGRRGSFTFASVLPGGSTSGSSSVAGSGMNPLIGRTAAELAALDISGAHALWLAYDPQNCGVLHPPAASAASSPVGAAAGAGAAGAAGAAGWSGLQRLAADCIARVLLGFEADVRAKFPAVSDKQLRKTIEQERAYLLPQASGAAKTRDSGEELKCMVRLLQQRFEADGSGCVVKSKFMLKWNAFAREAFASRNTQLPVNCVLL